MPRRKPKQDDKPGGLPPWMATFSDMVTLLLTFFVMLMAMANFENSARVDAVMESIREALGVSGWDEARLQSFEAEHLTEDTRREETVQPVMVRLREAMSKHVSEDMMRITQRDNEIRIRLDERVFFRPGSAALHPAAYALLVDVASIVNEEQVDLTVEGHSDGSGADKDNWEISAMRALAVVGGLRERGEVPGKQLMVAAFGSHRPASTFSKDDPWNRRIELVVKGDAVGAAAVIDRLQSGD